MATDAIPLDNYIEPPPVQYDEVEHSGTIAKLVLALAKAQLLFKPVLKQNENAAFTRGNKVSYYADLATYIDATQAALASNELVVMQWPNISLDAKSMTLVTILAHSSGEWMRGRITLPALGRDGFSAQSCGSSITYARRYAYAAILGCASEDDDGNGASGRGTSEQAQSVGNKKVAELMKPDPGAALFFVWPTEADGRYAQVTGDRKLQEANAELLRHNGSFSRIDAKDPGHWTIPADKFDDLKYQLEQRNVRFEKLKAK